MYCLDIWHPVSSPDSWLVSPEGIPDRWRPCCAVSATRHPPVLHGECKRRSCKLYEIGLQWTARICKENDLASILISGHQKVSENGSVLSFEYLFATQRHIFVATHGFNHRQQQWFLVGAQTGRFDIQKKSGHSLVFSSVIFKFKDVAFLWKRPGIEGMGNSESREDSQTCLSKGAALFIMWFGGDFCDSVWWSWSHIVDPGATRGLKEVIVWRWVLQRWSKSVEPLNTIIVYAHCVCKTRYLFCYHSCTVTLCPQALSMQQDLSISLLPASDLVVTRMSFHET